MFSGCIGKHPPHKPPATATPKEPNKSWLNVLMLMVIIFSTSCSNNESAEIEQTPTAAPSSQPSTTLPDNQGNALATSSPSSGGNSSVSPQCYIEDLPAGYVESPAAQGLKFFTDRNDLELIYIYFPVNCSMEDIEHDLELLFFGDIIKDDQIALFFLEPSVEGTLGKLYGHLLFYNFWAMGPEDYPMVLDKRGDIESNIIVFRVDRMYGEGHEGDAILPLMQGMAEHEYIHSVQGRNNFDLAEMIWSDGVYRYFIENYANIRNNAGKMYYEASYTLLILLQFCDGLNSLGTLEEKVEDILAEQGMSAETFLDRDLLIYNQHIKAHVEQVAGPNYLERLEYGEISPMVLVEMAGSGDIEAYEVIRRLYDESIGEYDEKFYGLTTEEYLPSFDELFSLY